MQDLKLSLTYWHVLLKLVLFFTVDHSRVMLKMDMGRRQSDYINANYVDVSMFIFNSFSYLV